MNQVKETIEDVTVTVAAEEFMRRMVRFGGQGPGAGFRLSVSPGGCSGFNSAFTVEAAPVQGDTVLYLNGLRIFLPAPSRQLLAGVTIDFRDTRTESGFAFLDPKADACACASGAPKGIQLTPLRS
jgi:iron-sulfur cluster assembly protein